MSARRSSGTGVGRPVALSMQTTTTRARASTSPPAESSRTTDSNTADVLPMRETHVWQS